MKSEASNTSQAIIFAAKELELSWIQGLNPFVERHGNDGDFNLNTGKGKRYPQQGRAMDQVISAIYSGRCQQILFVVSRFYL